MVIFAKTSLLINISKVKPLGWRNVLLLRNNGHTSINKRILIVQMNASLEVKPSLKSEGGKSSSKPNEVASLKKKIAFLESKLQQEAK